tara:strand:- start:337 stop:2439 length:2103 start_codon:yes stop_codon:yes gene_type:complete
MAGQNSLGEHLEDAYRFDSQTQIWEQIADFPGGPRGYAYGVSNDTMAYVGFGSNSSESGTIYPTDWWAYDILNNEWNQLSDFPSAGRRHPALVIVNDKIYVGLGSNTSNLGDWWEYDILNDVWSQKADLPGNDRHHPYYFSINNYAYVGFGHGSLTGPGSNPLSNSYIYNDFYRYNPETNDWLQLADFPSESRVAGTQFSYNGKGYLLSGDGDNHGPLDSGELWEYTPESDSWIQLESHPGNARWAPGCFVINCDLYFTSGYDRINQVYFNDLIKFKLGDDCGCTDSTALNYDELALFNDFNCCYVSGCTDPLALNYNLSACYDDSSCISPILGCLNPFSENYNSSSNTLVANGGPIDNLSYGVGGYHTNDEYDMVFDCLNDVTINSVDVYSQTSFIVQIEILDINDIQIYTDTFLLDEGLNTLFIDYDLVIGNDYKIGVTGNNQGLYRNSDLESSLFPINVLDHISITANTTSNPQSYFYYFYNWQLSVSCDDVYGCMDTIACNYFDFATIDDSSCEYLDGICETCEYGLIIDNDIDNDGICDDDEVISFDCINNECIDPGNNSGEFLNFDECIQNCTSNNETWRCDNGVCGVLNDGSGEYLSLEACEKDCEVISVIEDELYFNIYPNPSQDLFTLELKSNSIIHIHILNLLGEEILNYNINSKGKHKINLDISSYPKGVYNLYIKVNKTYYSRKLILQ